MHLQRRRHFLATSATLLASGALAHLAVAQETKNPPPSIPKAPTKPPTLPPEKSQAIVGAAQRSLDQVRELVSVTPLLVNACWDWGGGDFETPLQAAAHTGQRAIAEFLLAHKARIDLYAAAMLGHLDLVKAALATDPRGLVLAAAVPGPHGFTLVHCAKQGGPTAKPVYDWLLASGVPATTMIHLPYIWPPGTKPST
ncbi:MAG: ankyrin repeat domain-containing protein [Opitutus sp.]|nr:ankyrin repeat domain-containing protein [Opitutus sp.]